MSCATTIDFQDGTLEGIGLGPQNAVFLSPTIDTQPVLNDQSQEVLAPPTLKAFANFPWGATCPPSSAPDPWLAELSLLPAGCQPQSFVGQTIRVTLLWHLDGGGLVTVPLTSVSLGTYAGGAVTYTDASMVYSDWSTLMHAFDLLVLQHTFLATDDGAQGVFLRLRLVSQDAALATTVHVARIEWVATPASGAAGSGVSPGNVGAAGSVGACSKGGSGGGAGGNDGGAGACGHIGEPCCPTAPACVQGACYTTVCSA
jgi:hypothetical protein